jgi:hypothetical protein
MNHIRENAETTKAFNEVLTPAEQEKARDKWEDLAQNYDGQMQIIEAAKNGDVTAVNYLYMQLIPQIASVFWKNFLGPEAKYRQKRISEGALYDYLATVYLVLLSAPYSEMEEDEAISKWKQNVRVNNTSDNWDFSMMYDDLSSIRSPLNTFDANYFDEDTNLIDKFGYYLMNYLKSEAKKMNYAEKRGGLTGKKRRGSEDDVNASVPFESIEQHVYEGPREEIENIELSSAWESFVVDINSQTDEREPQPVDVLAEYMRNEGKLSVKDLAEVFDTSSQTIRNKLTKAADLMKNHNMDASDLKALLKRFGGADLADDLESAY